MAAFWAKVREGLAILRREKPWTKWPFANKRPGEK